MALNDAIPFYREKGPLTYATSLHVEKLDKWMNYSNGAETHSGQRTRTHPTYQWHIHRDGGTTGLFAVLIGLLMGYDKIILAGCPTDASPRYFEDIPHPQFGLDTIKDEWLRARDAVFNGKVKSLSGRSREWLGEP